MWEGSTVYWLLTDHLGSTAITAYSSGSKKAELCYYPWGETRYSYGSTPTSLRFTGQREDATIGLYFYNARYYDPSLGRFISADTVVPNPGNPQDFNRYSYTRNNPLRYTDPTGHYISLEDDFGVRITNEGVIQIVHGGRRFANRVEVLLANAILSGNPRHGETIISGQSPWHVRRSLANVKAELGYQENGAADWSLDPTLITGLAFAAITMIRGGEVGPLNIPAGERLEYTETPRDAAARRWRPGDAINAPTRHGDPSWSTVRRRWRINETMNNPGDWSEENLARMRRNLAPLHPKTGEPLHLHHKYGRNIPDPHNPANLEPLWESEHYRWHYGGR